jgi:hypothetical protein
MSDSSILSKLSDTVKKLLTSKDNHMRFREIEDEIVVRVEDHVIRYESIQTSGYSVKRSMIEQQEIKKQILCEDLETNLGHHAHLEAVN